MHLRRVKVKSGDSHRHYSQIVQSYRREDGVTAQRVVASLGCLTDEAHENFRLALKASRDGQRVVTLPACGVLPQKPDACLRYLDLAVLVELWRSSLADIVAAALPPQAAPGAADVAAALALQRCVAAGSKLHSIRWLPHTALPELLGINIREYNNTRVHRVLNSLEAATPGIMSRLAPSIKKQEGFASLFIDVTDTWFEGKGPVVAAKGKTKEGLTKRKVGIVLMCSEQGYPLRWEVCEGNSADCTAMGDMARKVSGLDWVSGTPFICDRAMGQPSTLAVMSEEKVSFVTALRESEFDGFGCSLPSRMFSNIAVSDCREVLPGDVAAVTSAAAVCDDLRKIDDDLFIKGLGEITWKTEDLIDPAEPTTVTAMRLCQRLEQAIADGSTRAAAARKLGITQTLASRYIRLSELTSDIQVSVLAGKGAEYGVNALLRVAEHNTPDMQHEAFYALLASAPKRDLRQSSSWSKRKDDRTVSVKVRAVAYFSPRYFVESRARGQRRHAEMGAFVEKLNQLARTQRRHYPRDKLVAAVENKLSRNNFLTMYEYKVTRDTENGNDHWQVKLKRNEEKWEEKRSTDGFMVIVAHPELPHGDEELVRLYRAKDRIERDFKTIKGLIQLRPIRHRQVIKVKAHVTVCMLSLYLERMLEARLGGPGCVSSEAALETLEPCRLSMLKLGGRRFYTSANLDKAQHGILKRLGMLHLADDSVIAERLMPRE